MQNLEVSRENELQTLLEDERSRCNQYKQIYQVLKEQHAGLQEELKDIHEQLKLAVAQNTQIKESNEKYVKRLEQLVKDKQEQINILSEKVVSLNPDRLKQKLIEEMTNHYEGLIKELQDKVHNSHENYNKLHYDHTVLKCQIDYSESEHSREIDVLRVQHLSEINTLRSHIETLENERDTPVKDYSVELRSSQKEVVQLNSKLKTAMSECDELRAQNEKLSLQIESTSRAHARGHAEQIANIRSLESEKSSITMRFEVLEKELDNCQEEKAACSSLLQETKQQCLSLQSRLEDCQNKYDIDMTNIKIEMQKNEAECEVEKSALLEDCNNLRLEVIKLKEKCEKEKLSLDEKEQTFQQHALLMKQQTWQKCNEYQHEKEVLELKLKELENTKKEELLELQQKIKVAEQHTQKVLEIKTGLEKELLVLRTRLEENAKNKEKENIYDQLIKQNEEFRNEINKLKEMVKQINTHCGETSQKCPHLDSNIFKQHECDGTTECKDVIQLRLTLERQKHEYQQRLDAVENRYREHQQSWENEKKDMQNKLRQYARLITKLREKLDFQKAQMEELEIQNELLKKNVPLEDHLHLKRQLSELQQKQEDFHQVMITASQFSLAGDDNLLGTTGLYKDISISPLQAEVPSTRLKTLDTNHSMVDINKQRPLKPKSQLRKRTAQRKKSELGLLPTYSSSDIENL